MLPAQQVVRGAVSLFVIVLVALSAAGWIWTGAHQPPEQSTASRTVLVIGMIGAVWGLWALWRPRPR